MLTRSEQLYNAMVEWLLEQPWAEHMQDISRHPRWAEYCALDAAEKAERKEKE